LSVKVLLIHIRKHNGMLHSKIVWIVLYLLPEQHI